MRNDLPGETNGIGAVSASISEISDTCTHTHTCTLVRSCVYTHHTYAHILTRIHMCMYDTRMHTGLCLQRPVTCALTHVHSAGRARRAGRALCEVCAWSLLNPSSLFYKINPTDCRAVRGLLRTPSTAGNSGGMFNQNVIFSKFSLFNKTGGGFPKKVPLRLS